MRAVLPATVLALGLAACAPSATVRVPPPASQPPVGSARGAIANIAGAAGSLVSGRLTLLPMADGVRIRGDIGGLIPGSSHGFHIHEVGDCSAADASSAGAHFNPANRPHGSADSAMHHAGDIDNIVADATGVAHVDAHVRGVSLGGGAAEDIAGRALVVHAAPDDYRTQPSGNSGARIACGVIAAQR